MFFFFFIWAVQEYTQCSTWGRGKGIRVPKARTMVGWPYAKPFQILTTLRVYTRQVLRALIEYLNFNFIHKSWICWINIRDLFLIFMFFYKSDGQIQVVRGGEWGQCSNFSPLCEYSNFQPFKIKPGSSKIYLKVNINYHSLSIYSLNYGYIK